MLMWVYVVGVHTTRVIVHMKFKHNNQVQLFKMPHAVVRISK